jgi:hypothetical protein
MKKFIILGVTISLIISACSQEEASPTAIKTSNKPTDITTINKTEIGSPEISESTDMSIPIAKMPLTETPVNPKLNVIASHNFDPYMSNFQKGMKWVYAFHGQSSQRSREENLKTHLSGEVSIEVIEVNGSLLTVEHIVEANNPGSSTPIRVYKKITLKKQSFNNLYLAELFYPSSTIPEKTGNSDHTKNASYQWETTGRKEIINVATGDYTADVLKGSGNLTIDQPQKTREGNLSHTVTILEKLWLSPGIGLLKMESKSAFGEDSPELSDYSEIWELKSFTP